MTAHVNTLTEAKRIDGERPGSLEKRKRAGNPFRVFLASAASWF